MSPWRRGAESGFVALIVGALQRWLWDGPFLPEQLALAIFANVPMDLFQFFVRNLGSLAKWVAFAGTIALTLVGSALVGLALGPLSRAGGRKGLWPRWLAISGGLTLVGALVVLPFLGADPLGGGLYPAPRIPAPLAIWITSAAYAGWYLLREDGWRALERAVSPGFKR